jgi:hypothetical protein
MENRSCRAWKPRADGERLGLIGAAAGMEAGHRRSMLEARPFAVRTAALAHDLCGYVQVLNDFLCFALSASVYLDVNHIAIVYG